MEGRLCEFGMGSCAILCSDKMLLTSELDDQDKYSNQQLTSGENTGIEESEPCKVRRKKTRRARKKRCTCRLTDDEFGSLPETGGCPKHSKLFSPPWSPVQRDKVDSTRRRYGKGLRPLSPKAPQNTTDFIIDDHMSVNQTHLVPGACTTWAGYQSQYSAKVNDETATSNVPSPGSAAVYAEMNNFEGNDSDLDMYDFVQRDFESMYTNMLKEKLYNDSKEELVVKVCTLEDQISNLHQKLETSVDIGNLLEELKTLQNENNNLVKENLLLQKSSNV